MRRKVYTLLAICFGAAGVGGSLAFAASETTGTNVSCATATLPAHTVGVDGQGVDTISGTSTTHCNTQTYTIPTVTTTVTGTPISSSSSSSTTTSSTSSAPPQSACTATPPGSSDTLNGQTYQRTGWDTFTKDAPTGSFASSDPSTVVYMGDHGLQWTEYPDGWPSTNSNGAIGYEPSSVLSVHDGMLDFSLHTNAAGHPVGANPSPKPSGSQYQTYGEYSMCERVVPSDSHNLDDFKQAVLLWPQADSNGPAAESDFPEGNLNANVMGGFAHFGAGGQDSYQTPTLDTSQWHVYTQTWGPGFRSYFVDGKLIGTSTSSVWSQPERWQLQVEPLAFNDGAAGHVDVGWVWVGGAPGGSSSSTSTTSTTTQTTPTTSSTQTSTTTSTTTTNPPLGQIKHVVVIFMENHGYSQIYQNSCCSFETSLADTYGLASNYYGTGHYSLDNYITATSGLLGVGNNDSCLKSSSDNIFHQLGAGNAINYEESGGACRHDPANQYSDLGSGFEAPLPSPPFSASAFDYAYAFISPSLCNDDHDCSPSTGDGWLAKEIPALQATPQYQEGSMAIFVTFDEDNGSGQGSTTPPNNHVYTAVISPATRGMVSSTQFTHCSLLRTTEDLLGVPALGCAAGAPSMVSAFNLG